VTFDGDVLEDHVAEDVEPGTYDYKVEKDGYETVEDTVEVVDEDVTVEVTLEEIPPTYTVTFEVTPEDATVTFDGDVLEDHVAEDVAPGTYDYKVEKDGYLTEEDTVEVVDEDVTVEVDLVAEVDNSSFIRLYRENFGDDDERINVYAGDIIYQLVNDGVREMDLLFNNRREENVIVADFYVDMVVDGDRERVWRMAEDNRTLDTGPTVVHPNLHLETQVFAGFDTVRVNDEDHMEIRAFEGENGEVWRDDIQMEFGAVQLMDDGIELWQTFQTLGDALAEDGDTANAFCNLLTEEQLVFADDFTVNLNGFDLEVEDGVVLFGDEEEYDAGIVAEAGHNFNL